MSANSIFTPGTTTASRTKWVVRRHALGIKRPVLNTGGAPYQRRVIGEGIVDDTDAVVERLQNDKYQATHAPRLAAGRGRDSGAASSAHPR